MVAVTVVLYGVRAWRWGGLLAPLGRVRYADLFSATMVGFASGLLVPRAGEILRPWLVSRRYPIATSAGFATIILERLVDLITVLGMFALYLFVLPTPAAQTHGRLMDLLKLGGALTGAGAVVVLAFLLALHTNAERVVGVIERLTSRAPRWIAEPVGRALRAFSDGLAVLRAPLPQLAAIAAQSVAIWLLIALELPPQPHRVRHRPAVPRDVPPDRLPGGRRRDPDARHGRRLPRLLPAGAQRGVRRRAGEGGRGRDRRPRARATCRSSCSGSRCSGARG